MFAYDYLKAAEAHLGTDALSTIFLDLFSADSELPPPADK